MKNYYFIKGIIVGIAKIIPGFSGAVLMISFGLYDKAIMAITHFFDHVLDNTFFLLKFGGGVLLGIVLFSKLILFFLNGYYLYTVSLFVGLILGGIPIVMKDVSVNRKNIILMVLSFVFVIFLLNSSHHFIYQINGNNRDLVMFFLAGVMEAVGTVLPGISSTALLMLMGIYSYYIGIVSQLFSISDIIANLFFLVPFSLGLLLGVIIISYLVSYLFQYYKERTFSVILGFSLASLVVIIVELFPYFCGAFSILISFLLVVCGFFVSSRL